LIDAVTLALCASPIPDVAADPPPSCVVLELAPGHIRYAAVVWTLKPGEEAVGVSAVLNRIYFGLKRAGIPVSEITTLLEMKAVTEGAGASANPVDMLRRTMIFRLLDDDGLSELGSKLRHLSFAPGELIVRQGDGGDSMYIVISGQVAINYAGKDGSEMQVAAVTSGDFFGEASLLTGETRNSSAVALTRVDCYELQKTGLEGVLGSRADLAEDMSVVLAHRLGELDLTREKLHLESARLEHSQTQILSRIRRFFGFDGNSAKA
jgi:CRP-like cAMP-binding protein